MYDSVSYIVREPPTTTESRQGNDMTNQTHTHEPTRAAAVPPTPAPPSPMLGAITEHRYGDSAVLRLREVPLPTVGDVQVLIRVHAAGLDRGTEHLMPGKPYAMRLGFGTRRPKTPVPGRDAAGTVVEVGAGVIRLRPG